MRYYKITFIGVGALAVLCLIGFVITLTLDSEQHREFIMLQNDVQQSMIAKNRAEGEQRAEEEKNRPLRSFLKAWNPYARPAPVKELGLFVRGTLTKEADRLSLAYDGVTVPQEPARFLLGSTNSTFFAQRNSITVSSESLPTLLTWLGQVEEKIPFARVENATLSAYGSRSVQLSVMLYFPLEQEPGKAVSGTAY